MILLLFDRELTVNTVQALQVLGKKRWRKFFQLKKTTYNHDKKKDVNKIFNKIFIIRRELYKNREERNASGVSCNHWSCKHCNHKEWFWSSHHSPIASQNLYEFDLKQTKTKTFSFSLHFSRCCFCNYSKIRIIEYRLNIEIKISGKRIKIPDSIGHTSMFSFYRIFRWIENFSPFLQNKLIID